MSNTVYLDVLINQYIPLEYPEVTEFVPAVPELHFFKEFQFQWDSIPFSPELHPFQGDAYDIPLAQAAFQAGLSYKDLLEAA